MDNDLLNLMMNSVMFKNETDEWTVNTIDNNNKYECDLNAN